MARSEIAAVEFAQGLVFFWSVPHKREYQSNVGGNLVTPRRIPHELSCSGDKQRDEYWVEEFFLIPSVVEF
jgi:hypothetical protein